MAFAFHEGERAVQARAGESAVALRNASVITDTVIAGARPFIEKQAMTAVAARAADGALWASLWFGAPGFLKSPEGRHIEVHTPAAQRDPSDPVWAQLHPEAPLGMLFIELSTRRRYRVNGHVHALQAEQMVLAIDEAYPNCPKYIQRRHLRALGEVQNLENPRISRGTELNAEGLAVLAQADTLFIASGAPAGHLDASHRGGPAGFVQALSATRLRVPDYGGNSLFNTLGNLALDPSCGLVLPDFAAGRLLHLSGRAELLWDQPDPQGLSGGTGRFWEFEVREWLLRELPTAMEWEYLDASPFLPTPVSA
ncbi:pyridoxamine 5'-phosphate oxidase family protein [Inhella proteolytica]|uniref:Pyridoxamine 5'-phosphate oxidase family protein n=1 Tax=Inhella proteolytica TaxID=2795029 RepID=A0A931J0S1_9BURK|nr:pyridoxamine 5'-phosphate oxidase family protein [Inhella proteolytica]MBH9576251.1 pyridoxamine 5'-phosphate oxidase family protein [Inhella proteolytica]